MLLSATNFDADVRVEALPLLVVFTIDHDLAEIQATPELVRFRSVAFGWSTSHVCTYSLMHYADTIKIWKKHAHGTAVCPQHSLRLF
jgi:hypothetical protein